jgi:pimeloyl-ACP methyl ester carboxylesterase
MAQATGESLEINGHRVATYRWGDGQRPVLLVHGWESRGSRFAELAERLLALGYSPITFDAPGHGDSGGHTTTILEYQAVVEALHLRHGPFEALVAHSFGVPCAFYAAKQGVVAKRIVAIGGVSDFRYLVDEFGSQLGLTPAVVTRLAARVEQLFTPLDAIWTRFSVTHETTALTQPILVVHDNDDDIVALAQGRKTARHFVEQARLVETRGLGHQRIMSDSAVVTAITDFVSAPQPAA